MKTYAEIAFTPAVQALQEANGSRASSARMQARGLRGEGLGDAETDFLADADSFFVASVGETGWPYVQHRGGPTGFLKVISPTRIAYADFRGNQQFVSAGNVSRDDRVAIIVMDYANRRRLKLLGRLRFETIAEADAELVFAVELPDYKARVDRVAVIDVEAFDWNCPQHITQRFTLAQVEAAANPLRERIAKLEAEVAGLRSR
ncbi:MAG: pyridoxamine 5-phosphate oxidase [Betaproteobacteria bacterium]|nr:pyridoxamine 5-phosphate oxidase [Betaproteobacteria bacterium]